MHFSTIIYTGNTDRPYNVHANLTDHHFKTMYFLYMCIIQSGSAYIYFKTFFFFTCTCMEKIFELKVQTSKVLFIFTYHLYKSLRSSPACRCTWMTQWYLYSCLREDTDSSSTHSCLPWQKIHTVQEVNSSFKEIIFPKYFQILVLIWIVMNSEETSHLLRSHLFPVHPAVHSHR